MNQQRKDRILEKLAENQFGQPGGYSSAAAIAKAHPFAATLSNIGSSIGSAGRSALDMGGKALKEVATMKQMDRARDMEMIENMSGSADKPGHVPATVRTSAAMGQPLPARQAQYAEKLKAMYPGGAARMTAGVSPNNLRQP